MCVCVNVCMYDLCRYISVNAYVCLCERGRDSKTPWENTGSSAWFSRGLQMEWGQGAWALCIVSHSSIWSLLLKTKV